MELMVGSKHLNSKLFRSKYVRENRHILTLVYNIRACLYEESQPGLVACFTGPVWLMPCFLINFFLC